LSEKEKNLIFKHFGHSQTVNQNVHQSTSGTMQLKTTGKQLLKLHTGDTSTNNEQQPSTSKRSEETGKTSKCEANKRTHNERKKIDKPKASIFILVLLFRSNLCDFLKKMVSGLK
jgi:hypothetical protein